MTLVHFEIEKWLMLRCGFDFYWVHSMPNKHNADRRHHIPKMSFKVQNWPEYEAGLRRRGSLTLWIEEDALDQWQSSGPEGQARYGEIAIQTCLMLRTVFKMAPRQTEGLIASVLTLPKLASAPKGPLHAQIDEEIGQVMADGAYDGAPTYETIAQYGDDIEVVIPPRKTAVFGTELSPSNQRDRHIDMIHTQGRLGWKTATGYGQRALVETTMGRYKSLIGPRLRAGGFEAQQTETAIGVAVLNRMLTTDAQIPSVVSKCPHNQSGVGVFPPSTFKCTNATATRLISARGLFSGRSPEIPV